VNVIKSSLEPLAPAVKLVTNAPLPSLAVFAALILEPVALGFNVKFGFVAILLLY
jgi:hypothetical protein